MSAYFKTAVDLNNSVKKDADYAAAVAQYRRDYKAWEKQTGNWLEENLSPAAKEKFLDISHMQFHCWGPPGQCKDLQVSETLEHFINASRNLQVIMQNRGVTF